MDCCKYITVSGIAVATHSPEWFAPKAKHVIDYNPLARSSVTGEEDYNMFRD